VDTQESEDSQDGQPADSEAGTAARDVFELPRAIARKLRECAESHPLDAPSQPGNIKYLWMNLDSQDVAIDADRPPVRMTVEEWLTVVDEAASFGIQSIVICVGDSFGNYPDIWEICRWAQRVHGLKVGFHTTSGELDAAAISQLAKLDPARTCLFVPKASLDAVSSIERAGIPICVADVHEDDRSLPCAGPRSLVFVGPGGTLYSCGFVFGNQQFELGHVLDKPLETVLSDTSLPRTVTVGTQTLGHGCDGCPNQMVKRMSGGADGLPERP